MILLSAIYAVSAKKHQTIIALAMGIPMLVALWVDKFIVTDRLLIAAHLLAVPFFAYTIVRLLSFIFTEYPGERSNHGKRIPSTDIGRFVLSNLVADNG